MVKFLLLIIGISYHYFTMCSDSVDTYCAVFEIAAFSKHLSFMLMLRTILMNVISRYRRVLCVFK